VSAWSSSLVVLSSKALSLHGIGNRFAKVCSSELLLSVVTLSFPFLHQSVQSGLPYCLACAANIPSYEYMFYNDLYDFGKWLSITIVPFGAQSSAHAKNTMTLCPSLAAADLLYSPTPNAPSSLARFPSLHPILSMNCQLLTHVPQPNIPTLFFPHAGSSSGCGC
jgi:hypothetical protein